MGAFNTITGDAICPVCETMGRFDVQFKYGDTWQFHYAIGSKLRWGGNDIGTEGVKRVVVEAVGGPCSKCGADLIDFDLLIEDDILVRIERHQQMMGP